MGVEPNKSVCTSTAVACLLVAIAQHSAAAHRSCGGSCGGFQSMTLSTVARSSVALARTLSSSTTKPLARSTFRFGSALATALHSSQPASTSWLHASTAQLRSSSSCRAHQPWVPCLQIALRARAAQLPGTKLNARKLGTSSEASSALVSELTFGSVEESMADSVMAVDPRIAEANRAAGTGAVRISVHLPTVFGQESSIVMVRNKRGGRGDPTGYRAWRGLTPLPK
mmetsp:Transcript_52550/g.87186  ORF Transcript_52550/g.87186 Transcript_52550/m.87186 type:complete len:227 (-) Transcript_52550:1789-2469(-)